MNEKVFNQRYVTKKLLSSQDDYFLWIGEDKQTHLPVCIKEFNKKSPNIPLAAKEFARECSLVQKLASMNSEYLVKIYFIDPQCAFYVMEYIQGQNVQDYIDGKNKIPEAKCLEIIVKISHVLSRIYNEFKIIHRNIEPKHILLRQSDLEPKLTGLGIIKAQDSMNLTLVNQVKGTFFYLAPELIYADSDAEREYSVQSDIYSLGLTFYFMVSGSSLFEKPEEIIQFVHSGKLPNKFRDFGNRNIAKAIFQMIDKDILKRLCDYEDVMKALQELQKSLGYPITKIDSPSIVAAVPSQEKSQSEKNIQEIGNLKKVVNDLIKGLKDIKDSTLSLESLNPKPAAAPASKEAQSKEKGYQEIQLLKRDVNSLIKVIKDLKERVTQLESIHSQNSF